MARVSRQWGILLALKEHLEGITPANGFDIDLANQVFIGRSQFGAETAPPMLSIMEAPQPDEPAHAGLFHTVVRFNWRLWIQGWAHNDDMAGLYLLKAETEERLASLTRRGATFMLGGRLAEVVVRPGQVRPVDPQRGTPAFMYVPVSLVVALKFDNLFVTT